MNGQLRLLEDKQDKERRIFDLIKPGGLTCVCVGGEHQKDNPCHTMTDISLSRNKLKISSKTNNSAAGIHASSYFPSRGLLSISCIEPGRLTILRVEKCSSRGSTPGWQFLLGGFVLR